MRIRVKGNTGSEPATSGEARAASGVRDAADAIFVREQTRLFGIAYRVLGSAADAEDIVQETWFRWKDVELAEVREPAAYLSTVTTRLSINLLQSARSQREVYLGPWIPEPIDTTSDPLLGAESSEALSTAVLLLLECLTPMERAAYVLREAFDYPYERIADIVDSTPANARQLVSRARKALRARHRKNAHNADGRGFLDRFRQAAHDGDTAQLEEFLLSEIPG